ncbi:hypothetical protein TBR22_A42150 [Luteitalea sp. TBR-22]|nr:hypothetical protein TBR22_A42150 [Luteitalea sp. TBR-22]
MLAAATVVPVEHAFDWVDAGGLLTPHGSKCLEFKVLARIYTVRKLRSDMSSKWLAAAD